jgi:hypothetical protein
MLDCQFQLLNLTHSLTTLYDPYVLTEINYQCLLIFDNVLEVLPWYSINIVLYNSFFFPIRR